MLLNFFLYRIRYSVDQEVDQGKWQTYPVPLKALPHETVGESLRLVHGEVKILLKPFGTVLIYSKYGE